MSRYSTENQSNHHHQIDAAESFAKSLDGLESGFHNAMSWACTSGQRLGSDVARLVPEIELISEQDAYKLRALNHGLARNMEGAFRRLSEISDDLNRRVMREFEVLGTGMWNATSSGMRELGTDRKTAASTLLEVAADKTASMIPGYGVVVHAERAAHVLSDPSAVTVPVKTTLDIVRRTWRDSDPAERRWNSKRAEIVFGNAGRDFILDRVVPGHGSVRMNAERKH